MGGTRLNVFRFDACEGYALQLARRVASVGYQIVVERLNDTGVDGISALESAGEFSHLRSDD
jgi:dihydrodipicolinate synthase/N-acetylneuraminate lyase